MPLTAVTSVGPARERSGAVEREGRDTGMQALFVGRPYIEISLLTDALTTSDERMAAPDSAIWPSDNVVTAAVCCAKL
jgi:hypothetical protein